MAEVVGLQGRPYQDRIYVTFLQYLMPAPPDRRFRSDWVLDQANANVVADEVVAALTRYAEPGLRDLSTNHENPSSMGASGTCRLALLHVLAHGVTSAEAYLSGRVTSAEAHLSGRLLERAGPLPSLT